MGAGRTDEKTKSETTRLIFCLTETIEVTEKDFLVCREPRQTKIFLLCDSLRALREVEKKHATKR
jgi:hypothetical protein